MNLKPLLVGLRKKVENCWKFPFMAWKREMGFQSTIALKPSKYEESEETFTYVQSEMQYTMKAQV